MLSTVFATKRSMTQAWTTDGRRMAVTRVLVEPNAVVAAHNLKTDSQKIFEIGYGTKKLKNMSKPLQSKLTRGGFSFGVKQMRGIHAPEDTAVAVGQIIKADEVLEVGDIVMVRGTSKGRGFSGAMKRHGFSGVGGRTHGQSDRSRAVGSIGAGTDPGRVIKGKRMPGQYGVETKTVTGLIVLHIDAATGEVWLSGPVPGATTSIVEITKTGNKKELELDKKASGIAEAAPAETVEAEAEPAPSEETEQTETTEEKA